MGGLRAHAPVPQPDLRQQGWRSLGEGALQSPTEPHGALQSRADGAEAEAVGLDACWFLQGTAEPLSEGMRRALVGGVKPRC